MMVRLLQDVGENHCRFLPLKADTAQCEAKGFGMQLIVKMQAPMHTRMEERKKAIGSILVLSPVPAQQTGSEPTVVNT
jgi:hypothetical protein